MLSNAYFLAKVRFDTAENEPAKNLQNFANFPNFAKGSFPASGGLQRPQRASFIVPVVLQLFFNKLYFHTARFLPSVAISSREVLVYLGPLSRTMPRKRI